MKRKKIVPVILAGLLAAVAAACCLGHPGASEPSGGEPSAVMVSASGTEEGTGNRSQPDLPEEEKSAPVDEAAAARAFSTLSDTLFMISGTNRSQTAIFGASGMLYEGNATLLRDGRRPSQYYIVSEQREDGQYTAVFDTEGQQVAGYDRRTITGLIGNYLVRGYYEMENTDAEVFTTDTALIDLRTGETVWELGRCRVRQLDGEHLLVGLQESEDSLTETLIVRQDDLAVVKCFLDSFGLSDQYQGFPMPDGCVLLWDRDYRNMRLYSFYLDQVFEDFNWFVGSDCIQLGKPGCYTYISLKTGETLYSDTDMDLIYAGEGIALWHKEEQYYMEKGDQLIPVQHASRWADDGSDDPYLHIVSEDGRLDILSQEGAVLLSVPAEGENSAEYLWDGWARRCEETGCTLYHISGEQYFFKGRQCVRPLRGLPEGKLRFVEWDGNKTDLLDETGRVYAESISGIDPVGIGANILRIDDGLIDLDGNLIWSEEGDK